MKSNRNYDSPQCEAMELETLSVVCGSEADSITIGDPWSGFDGEEEW
ncbi:MAG: hypothetical protein ACI399_04160 [Candidatus Cryptobacteroides sp.]